MKEKNNFSFLYIVQSVYACILNIIYKVTIKISANVRNRIIQVSLIFYAGWIILMRSNPVTKVSINSYDAGIVLGATILVITVFSVNKPLQRIKWNKSICFFYYMTGILMFISCLINETGTGHRIMIIEWLFLFPMLYYVWSNRGDYSVLFETVAKAFCYVGIIYAVILLLVFPKELYSTVNGAYIGSTSNPNTLALVVCSSVIAGLYLYITKKSKAIPLITVCMGTGIVIMAESRTALLSICVSILSILVFTVYDRLKTRELIYSKKIILIVICIGCICISVPIVEYLFDIVRAALAESNGMMGKLQKGGNLNAISSGRIDLWAYCIDNSRLLGNDVGDSISFASTNYWGAHNSIIEMMYRYGVLAGVSYIGVWVTAFIGSIKGFIHSSYEKGMFNIIILPAFFIMAMLEIVFKPFNVGLAFMNIFVFCPLFKHSCVDEGKRIDE